MNKKIWVSVILVSAGIFVAGPILAILLNGLSNYLAKPGISPVLGIFGIIIFIFSIIQLVIIFTVVPFVTIYKNWDAIQDNESKVSVGKAIGFLFIPFFSLYWIFKVWGGFQKEHNDFADRNNLAVPKLSSNTFWIFPACNILLPIIQIFLLILFYVTMIGTAYALMNANAGQAAAPSAAMIALLVGVGMIPLLIIIVPTIILASVLGSVVSESCDAVNNIAAAKRIKDSGNLPSSDGSDFSKSSHKFLNPLIMKGLILSAVLSVGLIFIASTAAFIFVPDFNAKTNATSDSTSNTDKTSTSSDGGKTFPDPNPDKKADFKMTADEYSKEADNIEDFESGLAKFNGKVVEISGRYYDLSGYSGTEVNFKTTKTPLRIKFDSPQTDKLTGIENGERITVKCEAKGTVRAELQSCVLLERKPAVTAGEKADLSVTAKEYYDEIGKTEMSPETRISNEKKYFGKVIDIKGKVDEISGQKTYLTSGGTEFVNCKPTNDKKMEFDALKEGQEATFRATHDGISLIGCIVVK